MENEEEDESLTIEATVSVTRKCDNENIFVSRKILVNPYGDTSKAIDKAIRACRENIEASSYKPPQPGTQPANLQGLPDTNMAGPVYTDNTTFKSDMNPDRVAARLAMARSTLRDLLKAHPQAIANGLKAIKPGKDIDDLDENECYRLNAYVQVAVNGKKKGG